MLIKLRVMVEHQNKLVFIRKSAVFDPVYIEHDFDGNATAVIQFSDLAVTAAATDTGDWAGRRSLWPVGRRRRRGDADSCP